MINIDLKLGMDGAIGGDIGLLMEEYKTVTAYLYALLLSQSQKNKIIFDNLIRDGKKAAKDIDPTIFKQVVNKKEPTLEEMQKVLNNYEKNKRFN